MRVLAIDPGLTRCGIAVVDGDSARRVSLVEAGVVRTAPDAPLEARLSTIYDAVLGYLARQDPDRMAIERVFAQNNVRTAMGTAQASGVVMLAAARSGLPVTSHTPSEVKAAVTGNGQADKKQVGQMVQRLLRLRAVPKPADVADALALAICHVWRAPLSDRMQSAVSSGSGSAHASTGGVGR